MTKYSRTYSAVHLLLLLLLLLLLQLLILLLKSPAEGIRSNKSDRSDDRRETNRTSRTTVTTVVGGNVLTNVNVSIGAGSTQCHKYESEQQRWTRVVLLSSRKRRLKEEKQGQEHVGCKCNIIRYNKTTMLCVLATNIFLGRCLDRSLANLVDVFHFRTLKMLKEPKLERQKSRLRWIVKMVSTWDVSEST
jgi:hypothetical protein